MSSRFVHHPLDSPEEVNRCRPRRLQPRGRTLHLPQQLSPRLRPRTDSGERDAHRCSNSDSGGASDDHPPDCVGDLLPPIEGPVEKTSRKDCLVDHLHRTSVPEDSPEREKVLHPLRGRVTLHSKGFCLSSALNLKIGSNRLANEVRMEAAIPSAAEPQ